MEIPVGELPERYPRTNYTRTANNWPECKHPKCTRLRIKHSEYCKEHAKESTPKCQPNIT